MGCQTTLSLNPQSIDQPMDAAAYDSTDKVIIGVRGGRVFKCDPTTGLILAQADYDQPGQSPACCVYDVGTGRVFAAVWNKPQFSNLSPFNTLSPRKIFRINPITLVTDLVIDFYSTFGLPDSQLGWTQAGVMSMRSVGANIYGRLVQNSAGVVQPSMGLFRFLAATPATNAKRLDTDLGYGASCAYASVGGHDLLFGTDQSNQGFNWFDFTSSTFTNGPMEVDNTKIMMGIEYSPANTSLYVSDQSQFIYQYTTAGILSATINTGRTTFNGVNIRYNSNDGFLYVAGAGDNTVVAVNPSNNTFRIIPGFDLPMDFVFTPTVKMAVQQGAVPLRVFI